MNNQDLITAALGSWSANINIASVILRAALALILSSIIGWERSSKRHSAGLRTFISITLAGTFAGMIDSYLHAAGSATENSYIICAATIVSAALISVYSILYNSRTQIRGLTTAASLWCMGVIGVGLGVGLYTAALCIFAVLMFALSFLPVLEKLLKDKSNHFEVHLELKSAGYLPAFSSTIRQLGMLIDDIELNPAYTGSGISVYSVSFTISSAELKKYKSHQEIIDALGSLEYVIFIEEMR